MTNVFNLQRILLSLGMIVFVGALVVGATGAFFSDTETSTGNTFAAGALDLKVDSQAHYNGMVCRITLDNGTDVGTEGELAWHDEDGNDTDVPADHYPQPGTPCEGTWTEKDLGAGVDHFFNLSDVKPGDEGENTISLHVYDNDAWGRFVIDGLVNADNDCTEPEDEAANENCTQQMPELLTGGELGANVTFYGWLDQGSIPGFQGTTTPDAGEGDNIWQCVDSDTATPQLTLEEYLALSPEALAALLNSTCDEPLVIYPGGVNDELPNDPLDEVHNIWTPLALYRGVINDTFCDETDANGDGQTGIVGNSSTYLACQGLANDGRLVGSTTYYFGLAWFIGDGVGNIIQTDSLVADLIFEVQQHRNNTVAPFGFPPVTP